MNEREKNREHQEHRIGDNDSVSEANTKIRDTTGSSAENNAASDPPPTSRLNLRDLFWGLTLLALGAVCVFALRSTNAGEPQPARGTTTLAATEQNPADVASLTDDQMQQVTVEPVTKRAFAVERETTGKVSFNEEEMTPVFTPYAGRVLEVNACKGAVVKAGQTLLTIESPELVAAQDELAEAQAEESKARVALDVAQKSAERARALHEREAMATKDLQQVESELERALDDLRRAQAKVTFVESRLALFGKNPGQMGEAASSGNPDRRVVIRAPISGTVVERKVGSGQYIKPDTPEPLFMISNLATVWVLADVFESYLASIRVGQPVQITVPAYQDRRFPARISFINPTVDPETRTVRVRCLVPNLGGLLKPEMFAHVDIGAATPQPEPVVPTGAIFTQGEESFVFVEEAPKRFRLRPVKTGRALDGYTLIESGLKADERVAAGGVLLINRIIQSDGRKG
jgi:membrane fusion protein, heavy metal efflux system